MVGRGWSQHLGSSNASPPGFQASWRPVAIGVVTESGEAFQSFLQENILDESTTYSRLFGVADLYCARLTHLTGKRLPSAPVVDCDVAPGPLWRVVRSPSGDATGRFALEGSTARLEPCFQRFGVRRGRSARSRDWVTAVAAGSARRGISAYLGKLSCRGNRVDTMICWWL